MIFVTLLVGWAAAAASQPSSQPASQPSSQPASQPSSQPASQPSSQPASQPSSQPASQPSSQSAAGTCSEQDFQALLKSLATHPAILSAQERALALEQRGRVESALPDPTVSVQARGLPLTEPWNMGRTPMGGVKVGAGSKVPWLPKLWARARAREHEADAVRTMTLEQRLDLLQQGLLVLVDDEEFVGMIRVQRDRSELLRSLSAVARANALVGGGSQSDAILLEARAAQADAIQIALRAQRTSLVGRWQAVFGSESTLPCTLGALAGEPKVSSALATPGPVLERLLERPLLEALSAQQRAARSREEAAVHDWVPEPKVQAGYVWRPDYGNFDGVDFMGAVLTVPLPVWPGRRLGASAAARAQRRKAAFDRDAFLRTAKGNVIALLSQIDAETKRLHELTTVARPVAAAASEVAQAAYRSSRATVGAIIEAERLLLDLESAVIRAEARQTRLRVRLWRILGGPGPGPEAK